MMKGTRRHVGWACVLITVAFLNPPSDASARPAIAVRGRMVTLVLPNDFIVEAYDRARDYDFEIMRDGLELADACLRDSLDTGPSVVPVPNWQALMGLSTRLRQLDRSIGEHRQNDDFERRQYDRFVAEQRGLLRSGISFVRINERVNEHESATPLDLHLYARAAVAWLRGYETHKLSAWLNERITHLPPFALRNPRSGPTLVRGGDVVTLPDVSPPRARASCARDLGGDNVIPFKRPTSP